MKIEKVAYLDFVSEIIATILSKEFGIEKCSYDDGPAEHGVLVLGSNTQHYYATSLSDLPIIVFDHHTDMYSVIKSHAARIPRTVSNSNWVYWRIKKGSETHLVLPKYDFFPGDLTIPAENKNNFHIYIIKECQNQVTGDLDSGGSHRLKALSVEDLQPLRKVEKQVSLDFDFLRTVDVEYAAYVKGYNQRWGRIRFLARLGTRF